VLALRVERRFQEVDVGDAGNLDRVLKSQENAFARALLGSEGEQVAAEVKDLAGVDTVIFAPGKHLRERALARTVRAHDGVYFAGADLEVDAAQDALVVDADLQIADL